MTFLSTSDMHKIHSISIELLQKQGMAIFSQKLLNELSSRGLEVRQGRVFFSENKLMELVSKAPSSFHLHSRGFKSIEVKQGSWTLASGYGCTTISSSDIPARPALWSDYIRFAKWSHISNEIDLNGGLLVQPKDTPAHEGALLLSAAMILSDKCLLGVPAYGKVLDAEFKLLQANAGGAKRLLDNPYAMFLISTNSPLKLDSTNCDVLTKCCKHRQALIVSPGPMLGATSPVTIAGTLALGNAEALATIAIIQALSPGNPVIYGMHPTVMNMSNASVSIGTPVFSSLCLSSVKLANMYKLPGRGSGSVTDADTPGIQSATESTFSLYSGYCADSAFVLHAAGILKSYGTMSYEKYLCDIENIRRIKFQYRAPNASEDTLALDAISRSVMGESFLSQEHTAIYCREDAYNSPVEKFINSTKLREGCDLYDSLYKAPSDSKELFNICSRILTDCGYDCNMLIDII